MKNEPAANPKMLTFVSIFEGAKFSRKFVVLSDNKCVQKNKKTIPLSESVNQNCSTFLRWSGLFVFLDTLSSNKTTNFLENLAPSKSGAIVTFGLAATVGVIYDMTLLIDFPVCSISYVFQKRYMKFQKKRG